MERYAQFFLTVNDGKWLIAWAVLELPCMKRALASGKVILKGGTTVSCIAELLLNYPLRISGRLTPEGAMASRHSTPQSYGLLIENGKYRGIDTDVDECMLRMGPGDVVVTGANIIDSHGGAAALAGSPGGFRWGRAAAAMVSEGADVIVPAGLEKLIPGSVIDSMKCARRKNIDSHDGMACGLFPVIGSIITEVEAIQTLADVDVCIIGRGGIHGAEGGTLFQIHGEAEEVKRVEAIAAQCKNQKIGGDETSLL